MDRREEILFESIDFSNPQVYNHPPFKERRSSIIVTLADNNDITPVDIQKMMEAGINVAKFKITHVLKGEKLKLLGKVDKAMNTLCRKYGVNEWPIATCIDLKTCICKVGILEKEENYITLEKDSEIVLTCDVTEFNKCNAHKLFVDNPYLAVDTKVGMEISLNQDNVIAHCTGIINDKCIQCIVTKSGKITNMCNVSFREMKHSRPYLTKKDMDIIKFALEYQVDIITINYVRHPETLRKTKQYIGKKINRPIILSGLSTQQGLDNIDDITKESDGIILSREYLPYELESSKIYRLTQIQKWVGAKCQQAGKPYFLSGGVFQHLLLTGMVCDSEIADVTNAVLDGVTGFILKDCDNIDNVLEALKLINDICRTVEPFSVSKADFWRVTDMMTRKDLVMRRSLFNNEGHQIGRMLQFHPGQGREISLEFLENENVTKVKMPLNATEAAVMSCAAVANQANVRAIILPTVTGRTAKALLTMRPSCLIITVSSKIRISRLLQTYRCVVPLIYDAPPHPIWNLEVETRILFAIEYAVKRGWLIYGDTYVSLQRANENSSFCDMVRLWKVTISKKSLVECEDPFEEQI